MKRFLIIGDVMMDRSYHSHAERISPEAPIPIHQVERIEEKLGGAGNVANNLSGLIQEGEEFLLLTVLGQKNEEDSVKLKGLLKNQEIINKIWRDPYRKTTVKNRIYNDHHLVARFDIESTHNISQEIEDEMYEFVKMEIQKERVKCILLSDYSKGVLTIPLCQKLISISNQYGIRVYVDPKVKEVEKYKHAFLVKPNRIEANGMMKKLHLIKEEDFLKYLDLKYCVITQGSEGIIGYSTDYEPIVVTHKEIKRVRDVTGCGDSVFAAFVYMYEMLYDGEEDQETMELSIEFANFVGGRAVENLGTYSTSHHDLEEFYEKKRKDNIQNIFHLTKHEKEIYSWITKIKRRYSKIVFTNGCFDVIHTGHLQLLHYAKSCGDYLILALNSDKSIKRLKGESRPIHHEEDRIDFLKNLKIADAIILFEEDTPEKLLSILKPNIMIKGGDYTPNSVLGREYCKEVKIFDFVDGYSSTKTIQKIKDRE
jgi:D-beta-D-heptose 7-phosphate kinase/D-beta-D-heptose 1-phosphate adenosyltransferase